MPAHTAGVKVSSPSAVFEKLLRSFETGGFTYAYVLTELKRLLENHAPPTELLRVLGRRQLIEPLPQDAYLEIFAVLDDAAARIATEEATAAEAKLADSDTPPDKAPEVIVAPVKPTPPAPRMQRSIVQTKSTQAALSSVFERVLSVFESSGFTDTDVLSQLKRLLLATGASPTSLLEALRRRQLIKPLPEHAHAQVLGVLNEVLGQTEAQVQGSDAAVVAPPLTVSSESVLPKTSAAPPVAAQVPPLTPPPVAAQVLPPTAPPSRIVVEELAATTPVRTLPPEAVVPKTSATPPVAAQVPPPSPPVVTSDSVAAKKETGEPSASNTSESVRVQVSALRPVPVPTSRRSQVEMPAAATSPTARNATQSTISTAPTAPASTRRTPMEQTAKVNASRMPLPESDAATADASVPAAPPPAAPSAPPAAKSTPNLLERRKAAVTSARRVLQDWLSATTRTATRDSAALKPGSAATAPDEEVTIDFDELARRDSVARFHIAVPAHAPQQASTRTLALKRGKPWKRDSLLRASGVGLAAIFTIAAVVSIVGHHSPVSVPVPAPALAALPEAGTLIRDCATCPAMTVLPAGRFQQGSARTESGSAPFEKPLHWVTIARPLAMSTNAVTVDEFQQFVAATGRDMQGCDTYDGTWKHRPTSSWKSPGFPQSVKHPVTCTSWNDAMAYAQWLSTKTGHAYRLPSASEWEYAARAGGAAVLPWNPDGSGACENGNVADESAAHRYPGWSVFGCKDGYVYTAPVGSFKSNAFGLNDMLGNVFQWTKDCWTVDYAGAPVDGSARTDGNCADHELRGGSWFSTPAYVRANYRNHFAADYRTSSVGIRLVRGFER